MMQNALEQGFTTCSCMVAYSFW